MASALLPLAPRYRLALEALVGRRATPQFLARRARIVLGLADIGCNAAVAQRCEVSKNTARNWRLRWEQKLPELESADDEALAGLLVSVLNDAPRPGAAPTFTPEQVARIVRLACEPPMIDDIPLGQWSCETLAEEAVRRGFVERISHQTVWRFLKSGRGQTAQGQALAHASEGRPRLR